MFNRRKDNRYTPDPNGEKYSYQESVYEQFIHNHEVELNKTKLLQSMVEAMYEKFNQRLGEDNINPRHNSYKAEMLLAVCSALTRQFGHLFDRSKPLHTTHPSIVRLPEALMCNESDAAPVARLLSQLTGFFVEHGLPHGHGSSRMFYVRTDLPRLFNGYHGRNMANPFAPLRPHGWVTRGTPRQ